MRSWLRRTSTRLARRDYPDLEAFCLFVGYPRSGHSLVGALLDAHPDVVVAHEANALKQAVRGTARADLFELLLANSRAEAERSGGRKSSGYSYAVEGQWQGRYRRLRVIGDKGGTRASFRLGRHPGQLDALARTTGLPLRLVHVTRNPYDTVARMSLITKGGMPEHSLASATELVGRLAEANEGLVSRGEPPTLTVRHESVIAEPRAALHGLCEFLGVEATDEYLEACARIVFASPRRTRDLVEWSEPELEAVERLIARHRFFHGYSWAAADPGEPGGP